jgi:(2R)-3-sulfolactate dehydrogenase (NADP+)
MLHSPEELNTLVQAALTKAGASPAQAGATALALVAAEASGLPSHGLSRVAMYVAHLKAGRVIGGAVPVIRNQRASAVLIDAGNGFAFPACRMAIDEAVERASKTGIAIAAVTNSHHFGMASYHLDAVASAGMVGIACGNSPAAMPAAGGKRPIFGTNPIAAIFPREGKHPVSIDLSLSEVARGKLMVAAKKGESIPLGWALDADGNPTTDPKKGMEGSMLPMGGVKGAMLALMVELLADRCALRRRGRHLFCRRRQPAPAGPGVHRDRSNRTGRRTRLQRADRGPAVGHAGGRRRADSGATPVRSHGQGRGIGHRGGRGDARGHQGPDLNPPRNS